MTQSRIRQIAKKDFMDAYRAWHLHFLVALFGLFGLMIAHVVDDATGEAITFLLIFIAPLVGLLFSQNAIVGKRVSHELNVLLGLPFSRRDIVIGTYIGRTALLAVAIVSIYATGLIWGLATGSSLSMDIFAAGFLLLVVLGTIFVSIALGLSAALRSSTFAWASSFVVYLLFVFQIWAIIPRAILYLINGFEFPTDTPEWARVFTQLSPFAAMKNVMRSVSSEFAANFPVAEAVTPDEIPIYMESWFGALVLCVWLVAPVAVGYLRFARSDL